jgi:hypothetical protein
LDFAMVAGAKTKAMPITIPVKSVAFIFCSRKVVKVDYEHMFIDQLLFVNGNLELQLRIRPIFGDISLC